MDVDVDKAMIIRVATVDPADIGRLRFMLRAFVWICGQPQSKYHNG